MTKTKANFTKNISSFWPQIFLFVIIFVFLARLFFPPSIFVTPDFGRSDSLNIQLAQDYVISQSLRNFRLPLWTSLAAQGYPLLAESMGTFFVPNLVILLLLPFEFAMPTIYLVSFLTAGFGMYFLLRSQKMERVPSIIGAIAFTFSASIILRVQHLSILQAVSVLPICLKIFLDVLEKPDKKNIILVSFLFSQMLFGFPQIFVYTAVSFWFLVIMKSLFEKNKKIGSFILSTILILIVTTAFCAIQFLPSYELLKESSREKSVDPQAILIAFPLNFRNLLSFINPYIVGSAKNGTYNSIDWKNNGVFWENTSYFGFLPFIASIVAIIYLAIKKRRGIFFYLAVAAIFTILLALGKLAPTHILYSFPPLSYFRVPARFIILSQFFLIILSAYTFNLMAKKLPNKIATATLFVSLFATIFELYFNWWNYNPIGKTSVWTNNIPIASFLKKANVSNGRILTLNSENIWNLEFTRNGWRNLDTYLYFQNAQDPNVNFFESIPSLGSYQVLQTRRQGLLDSLLAEDIKPQNNTIQIGTTAQKVINLANVKYFITSIPLKNANTDPVYQISKYNITYYVYQNQNVRSKFNLFYDIKPIERIGDYISAFKTEDLAKMTLLENPPSKLIQPGNGSIKLEKETEDTAELTVSTDKEGVLQYASSFYPGWKAKVDGKEVKIYASDINSKAIFVPSGIHKVIFYYQPRSFAIGATITIFALLLSLVIIFWEQILKLINRDIKIPFF